jgi:hypothetical protein
MKILPNAQERIKPYAKSIEALEMAFAYAEIDIEFVANVTRYDCLFIGPKVRLTEDEARYASEMQ